MRHERANEQHQETAALYALGALSQHEARAFEVHLREGCQACQDELLKFEATVNQLGLAAPAVEPPAYLRDLLMARIDRERQAAPASAPEPAPEPIRQEQTSDSPLPVQPSIARQYLPWAIAASVAALSLFSIAAWWQAKQQATDQQQQLAALRNETEQLKTMLNQLNQKRNELEQINMALSSPGAQVIVLQGQEPAPTSSARIYWNKQDRQWIVTANLPAPPTGKTYQLWFVTANARISAGLIKPDETGHGFAVINVPEDIKQLAAAAITLEPEGGSAQPTMPIYALGKIG